MDSETGQRLAEMIATAVVTKLTDKAIDELLEYLKQKEKNSSNQVARQRIKEFSRSGGGLPACSYYNTDWRKDNDKKSNFINRA